MKLTNNQPFLGITPGIALRMAADAMLLVMALLFGLVIRLLYLIVFEKPDNVTATFYVMRDAKNFLYAAPTLVFVALITFWLSGFYTYGKKYLSKYKPIVVAQAVSMAFLLWGFFAYFLSGGVLPIARGGLPLGWLFAMALLVGARVWTDLWKGYVDPERQRVIRANAEYRRVLVIGGAGYIGSALVPLLLSEGYRVRVLDILLFGEGPLEPVRNHPNLEIVRGDVRNVVTLFQSMQDVSSVVHLGAIVGDPACQLNEELTIDINLVSTQVIAELAKHAGVQRFVFASTCSVYGASNDLLDERSAVHPISLYGHTKHASERVLLDVAGDGFLPTILRFATIYGFSGRTRFDLVVNLLTAKARLDGEISVHGGDQWRPFVHVEDAARAIVMTLNAPLDRVARQTFNVGSDAQNYTIRQVAEVIRDRVLNSHVVVSESNTDNRNYRVSFAKIRRELGFEPKWTLEDGIQQVLEAIASGEVTNYEDAIYSNAKFLTEEGTDKFIHDQWARNLISDASGG